MKNFILTRIKSFQFAFQGFKPVFTSQKNMLIHFFATIVVIGMGVYLSITCIEWICVLFAIGFVWVCEFFNSAIEILANVVSPDFNEQIKQVKDISAAAVLISAIVAVIVGIFVFGKYIWL
jgi:diacylglycerol kinase